MLNTFSFLILLLCLTFTYKGVSGSSCKKLRCGIPGKKSRIIGGNKATPHEFPWMVRLHSKEGSVCGGALVSPKVVLSAFHCQYEEGKVWKTGTAILGAHKNPLKPHKDQQRIPYSDVRYPKHPQIPGESWKYNEHDFLLIILDKPAKMSDKVRPICLPPPNGKYGGLSATAAGWGRFKKNDVNPNQSQVLRKVTLTVSKKVYRHYHYFGTLLRKNSNGQWKDPCGGDSGGPLMIQSKKTKRWTLIGTVMGQGYDCTHNVVDTLEGSNNGVWNKVSSHSKWLKKTMKNLKEPICRDV